MHTRPVTLFSRAGPLSLAAWKPSSRHPVPPPTPTVNVVMTWATVNRAPASPAIGNCALASRIPVTHVLGARDSAARVLVRGTVQSRALRSLAAESRTAKSPTQGNRAAESRAIEGRAIESRGTSGSRAALGPAAVGRALKKPAPARPDRPAHLARRLSLARRPSQARLARVPYLGAVPRTDRFPRQPRTHPRLRPRT